MKKRDKFGFRIGNDYIEVSEEIYTEYYRLYERERQLRKMATIKHVPMGIRNGDDENGFDFVDRETKTPEDMLLESEAANEKRQLIQVMMTCLDLLNEVELQIIKEIYFNGKTERELSKIIGIPQKTINDRKNKALRLLKSFIKK